MITELLASYDIKLHLVCVVGGENIFKATMEYLVELVDASEGYLEITVAANDYYPCLPEQKDALNDYVQINKLPLIHFDLVKDKGESSMRTVKNVLQDGKGTVGLNAFTAIHFKKPIQELNL
jgi:hypothetical protein